MKVFRRPQYCLNFAGQEAIYSELSEPDILLIIQALTPTEREQLRVFHPMWDEWKPISQIPEFNNVKFQLSRGVKAPPPAITRKTAKPSQALSATGAGSLKPPPPPTRKTPPSNEVRSLSGKPVVAPGKSPSAASLAVPYKPQGKPAAQPPTANAAKKSPAVKAKPTAEELIHKLKLAQQKATAQLQALEKIKAGQKKGAAAAPPKAPPGVRPPAPPQGKPSAQRPGPRPTGPAARKVATNMAIAPTPRSGATARQPVLRPGSPSPPRQPLAKRPPPPGAPRPQGKPAQPLTRRPQQGAQRPQAAQRLATPSGQGVTSRPPQKPAPAGQRPKPPAARPATSVPKDPNGQPMKLIPVTAKILFTFPDLPKFQSLITHVSLPRIRVSKNLPLKPQQDVKVQVEYLHHKYSLAGQLETKDQRNIFLLKSTPDLVFFLDLLKILGL